VKTGALRSKDFWAGALYVGLGVAALWIARDYTFGTASRMGAGYFPTVLAGFLVMIGIASLVRAFVSTGQLVDALHLKPLLLIVGAVVLFAIVLPKAGFVIALLAMALVSARASQHFRVEVGALAGLILLVTACSLIFVKGLGLPLPLVGSWFAN
jgi:hypothetical protein